MPTTGPTRDLFLQYWYDFVAALNTAQFWLGAALVGLLLGAIAILLMRKQQRRLTEQYQRQRSIQNAEHHHEQQLLQHEIEYLDSQQRELRNQVASFQGREREWQERYYTEQSTLHATKAQLEDRATQFATASQQLETETEAHKQARIALAQTEEKNRALAQQLAAAQENQAQNQRFVTDTKQQLKTEFTNIANQLFDTKSQTLKTQNQENLSQILTPLKEQLNEFKQRVNDVYDKESQARASLVTEITALKDINLKMSDDAVRLTKALQGEQKVQGNWGELVLERVLESSGLRSGIEYETQINLKAPDGAKRQPDVVVHLPDAKDVIIDSKVSLTAWEAYCNAEDDAVREQSIQRLLTSFKAHIRGLSQKNYNDLEGVRSLDFVLMFVPIEGAFLKALETDNHFFINAFDDNIMVVSPSTLLVTLRTIQNLWRNEYQNQNAQKIADSAGGLHDQFVLFTESLTGISDYLNKAQRAYEQAEKRLVSGKGNLVRRTQQLATLGAKNRKSLPSNLEAKLDPDTELPLDSDSEADTESKVDSDGERDTESTLEAETDSA